MRYAVKYRLSDGGVVDFWRGPDQVPAEDGHGQRTLEQAPRGPGELALDVLGVKRPARFRLRMTSPIPLLAGAGQGALEITQAQHAALGPVTERDGRLRWRVVDGQLVANREEIYSTVRIADAPATNEGELHIRLPVPRLGR